MRQPSPKQTRKIQPTRRSVSGIYAFRGRTGIPYESTLERDFLIRTEFFLSVVEVIPQPVQIPFNGRNGQIYTYTPDFFVRFQTGAHGTTREHKSLLIEVKPTSAWREHWREWAPKWKAARRYAMDQGWQFRIADELRIRDGIFNNINHLTRYKRMSFPKELCRTAVDQVHNWQTATVSKLIKSLVEYGQGAHCNYESLIWHLVATRQLECDIDSPLSKQTLLWIPIAHGRHSTPFLPNPL